MGMLLRSFKAPIRLFARRRLVISSMLQRLAFAFFFIRRRSESRRDGDRRAINASAVLIDRFMAAAAMLLNYQTLKSICGRT